VNVCTQGGSQHLTTTTCSTPFTVLDWTGELCISEVSLVGSLLDLISLKDKRIQVPYSDDYEFTLKPVRLFARFTPKPVQVPTRFTLKLVNLSIRFTLEICPLTAWFTCDFNQCLQLLLECGLSIHWGSGRKWWGPFRPVIRCRAASAALYLNVTWYLRCLST